MEKYHDRESKEIEESTYIVIDMIASIIENGNFDDEKLDEFHKCQNKYLVVMNRTLRALKFLKKK